MPGRFTIDIIRREFDVPYRYLYKEYTDGRMLSELREIIERMISQRSDPVIAVHCYKQQIMLKIDEKLYIQLTKRGCKVIVCPDVELKGVIGYIYPAGNYDPAGSILF